MATKIQVRRDTTANWTTYGAEVPAAGEFCYDTDLKTLKIGDGVTAYRDLNVIADADFDATQINDNYVAVTGDNMTGDLTLGTDKITLDATDGSAEFTGVVDVGSTLKVINESGQAESKLAIIGNVNNTTNYGKYVFTPRNFWIGPDVVDKNQATIEFDVNDGSAEFAGAVFHGNTLAGGGGGNYMSQGEFAAYAPGASNRVFRGLDASGSSNVNTSEILGNGSATFTGAVTAPNVTFNLEPDNDSNYVSTTDAEGNQTRVYNGPTLDVKEKLMEAMATIEDLKTRLAALEGVA